ncbi:unnamed protein product [Cylicocyclus nassatus]|uniref:Uncharacterized protein n=1 Tax=Cylicocyclus nassatus TaxID=53992 RepID=A0AA36DP31_CYLNA|nr:unnamed protein product [Cylicocyclus nassatus]
MNAKCFVRLYCNIVDNTRPSSSSLPLTFVNPRKKRPSLYPSVPSYEEFSPDFQSSSQIEEAPTPSESALPDTLSKQELYVHADELATAKKSGCAPTKRALTLIRGVLHARSLLKTSLSDRSVTIFNFHSTEFAEKLVQSNIGSLVIVESDRTYARQAKIYAKAQRAQSRNVAAYRTELATLLGISRKKVSAFPSHLLSAKPEVPKHPFSLAAVAPGDESGNPYATSPILVSTLPVDSQQKSVLEALLNNLLLHHAGLDEETLYAYGQVELVTFLSAFTISHLLASADPRLSFMAHSARRSSELFFKLFDIELLRLEGFSRRSFIPPISIPKKIPHEKRLKEVDIVNGLLYAISIRPHRCVTLGGADVGGSSLSPRVLLSFAYWLNTVGKQQASKRLSKVLKELCPESASAALEKVDGNYKIGDAPSEIVETAFLGVREELEHAKNFERYKELITTKRST